MQRRKLITQKELNLGDRGRIASAWLGAIVVEIENDDG